MLDIFDILGPVMIGPSSSHTAGAARIGAMARTLLGAPPVKAAIHLYGSFAETGAGHGTDRALVGGLLGMKPDDPRLPFAFDAAEKTGLTFTIDEISLREAHPNTAVIEAWDSEGKKLTMQASSLGGGRIMVTEFNGLQAKFSCDLPTLIVQNTDQPGRVGIVTSLLAKEKINIATLHVYRDHPGGNAVMIIEMDKPASKAIVESLSKAEGIKRVITVGGER